MDISHRYAGRFLLLSMTSRWPPGMLGILLDRRKRFQTHCPDNLCRASAGPSTYSSNRSWRSCSSRALGRSARTTPTAGGALAAGCAIAPCECRASKKVAARRKAHTLSVIYHLSPSVPLQVYGSPPQGPAQSAGANMPPSATFLNSSTCKQPKRSGS